MLHTITVTTTHKVHTIADTITHMLHTITVTTTHKVHTVYYMGRRGRGRDRVVVGFTTTFAISAYHH
jgi:hypothetical protein